MKKYEFNFKGIGNIDIFACKWSPEEGVKPKGIVQIAHGMSERVERYENVIESLTKAGYIVYGNDHRGHGNTAKIIENLGFLEKDCFNSMVEDLHGLTQIIKAENPELPVFLLGHSMGSFLTQRYICLYGKELSGAVLSGSNGSQGIITYLGIIIGKLEILRIGRDKKSNFMTKLSFGGFNKPFTPNKTAFDWLTRDEAEVEKYIQDPYCGYNYNSGFYYDLLQGLKLISNEKEISRIPKNLPIYIFSGDRDPVGKFGKGVLKLLESYNKIGIKELKCKLYKQGRHEMFNETNKEEVLENLIEWLDGHIKTA